MHRNQLLAELAAYGKANPEEAETVHRYLDFVRNHSNCFERSLASGHVTGSAWVVNGTNTHALFTHHCKLGTWLQVGGHADGDSNTQNVALREASEESGLRGLKLATDAIFDIDIHQIPARKDEPSHFHYDVRYLIQATGDETLQISNESNDLAWFSPAEILALFQDRSILRMLHKWQELAT